VILQPARQAATESGGAWATAWESFAPKRRWELPNCYWLSPGAASSRGLQPLRTCFRRVGLISDRIVSGVRQSLRRVELMGPILHFRRTSVGRSDGRGWTGVHRNL